jgi:hypothetical protein
MNKSFGVLTKEEFIIQYVLNRASAVTSSTSLLVSIVEDAIKIYNKIMEERNIDLKENEYLWNKQ